MEPVFMILGQSAGVAAALAIDDGASVQAVNYAELRERLVADGQVVDRSSLGIDPGSLPGILVDDGDASFTGTWEVSTSRQPFVAGGYWHDLNEGKGDKTVRFAFDVPIAGGYEVRLAYASDPNRASNTPVRIEHGLGVAELSVDQRVAPPLGDLFVSVGVFQFAGSGAVEVSTTGTDGYVIVDAVQLLYMD
jgi:hypothetical protein